MTQVRSARVRAWTIDGPDCSSFMTVSTSSIAWPSGGDRSGFRFGRETFGERPGVRSLGEAGWSVDWVLERAGTGPLAWGARRMVPFYAVLCGLSLAVASTFWAHGAHVVMPLAWLELMLVGGTVWALARHASDRECIVLRGDRLTVERACGSHVERVEFQPAWVRVEPEHGDRSLIELSGQGRRIAVGRFVAPEQRRQLAEELRLALRRWHQGTREPASM